MANPAPTRFRYSAAITVAAIIAMVGTLPLLKASGWYALVLLVPLAIAIRAWRAGTDVTPAGLRVRALLGSRTIPWADVVELGTDPRRRAVARLTSGTVVPLPAVSAADLPRLVEAANAESAG